MADRKINYFTGKTMSPQSSNPGDLCLVVVSADGKKTEIFNPQRHKPEDASPAIWYSDDDILPLNNNLIVYKVDNPPKEGEKLPITSVRILQQIGAKNGQGLFFAKAERGGKPGTVNVQTYIDESGDRPKKLAVLDLETLAFQAKTSSFVGGQKLYDEITGKAQVVTPQPIVEPLLPNPLADLGDKDKKMPKARESKPGLVMGFLQKAKDLAIGAIPYFLRTARDTALAPVTGVDGALKASVALTKENPAQFDDEKTQAKSDNMRKAGLVGRLGLSLFNLVLGAKSMAQAALATLSIFSPAAEPKPNVTVGNDGMPVVAIKEKKAPQTPFPSQSGLITLSLTVAAQREAERRGSKDPKIPEQKGRG